jgi:hypothetical protein
MKKAQHRDPFREAVRRKYGQDLNLDPYDLANRLVDRDWLDDHELELIAMVLVDCGKPRPKHRPASPEADRKRRRICEDYFVLKAENPAKREKWLKGKVAAKHAVTAAYVAQCIRRITPERAAWIVKSADLRRQYEEAFQELEDEGRALPEAAA